VIKLSSMVRIRETCTIYRCFHTRPPKQSSFLEVARNKKVKFRALRLHDENCIGARPVVIEGIAHKTLHDEWRHNPKAWFRVRRE
jgi:hypothetical protein